MHMIRPATIVISTLLLTTAAAQAAPSFSDRIGKTYLQLNAGAVMEQDTDFNLNSATNVENTYDDGYVINGAIGHNVGKFYFIDNVKFDLELGYASSSVDAHNVNGAPLANSVGDLNTTTVLANMYHEYDTGTRFVPYYGLGIGIASVDIDNFGSTTNTVLDDSEVTFAYQASAGVNYIVTDHVDIGMRYRFNGAEGIEIVGSDGTTTDFSPMAHQLTAGVNVNF